MSGAVDDLIAAARMVGRVMRQGAYSNVLVGEHGGGGSGRAHALVYQTIRKLRAIDTALAEASDRRIGELDDQVLDLLRVAVANLEGEAEPALVVDVGVRAAKLVAPRAAGFVNAVLRRVTASGIPDDPLRGLPAWTVDRLQRAWGPDDTASFLEASDHPPAVGVRVRPGGSPPPDAEPVSGIAGAYLWRGGELAQGVVVQDPASVAVGLAADPMPGEVCLDVGASPGGKTMHLIDLLRERGDPEPRVVAIDVHPRRVKTGAKRVPEARWLVADGRRPPLEARSFDLVVVDAPCTGLGTLRRRPEIRHRLTEEDAHRLAQVQRRLVEAAAELVAPGGRLVYSVCTVLAEETVEVVARGFHPPDGLPGRVWGAGRLLGPHLGPYDGMFIAISDG